jgi:putative transcriptional regulator
MGDRDIGQEILEGVKEIKDSKKGQKKLRSHALEERSPPKIIREKLELLQAAFASLLGVSAQTIQDWEKGRRQPQGPAKSLLRIAEKRAEILAELQ